MMMFYHQDSLSVYLSNAFLLIPSEYIDSIPSFSHVYVAYISLAPDHMAVTMDPFYRSPMAYPHARIQALTE